MGGIHCVKIDGLKPNVFLSGLARGAAFVSDKITAGAQLCLVVDRQGRIVCGLLSRLGFNVVDDSQLGLS